jgi:hypothetical protein
MDIFEISEGVFVPSRDDLGLFLVDAQIPCGVFGKAAGAKKFPRGPWKIAPSASRGIAPP